MGHPAIKPGVCGICGVAVVQPESAGPGWHNGHFWERLLKGNGPGTELVLKKVRCMTHKEPGDRREYDDRGNVVEGHRCGAGRYFESR